MDQTVGIIVAAGKGIRMGSDERKQYLMLGKLPMLCHTVLAFNACNDIDRIILVIPEGDSGICRTNILNRLHLSKPIELVSGGKERQDSVRNGLNTIHDLDGIVVIHDGVRPFIRPDLISESIRTAKGAGACAVGVRAQDTLKCTDASDVVRETFDRERIWIAQTPQTFHSRIIKTAHEHALREGVLVTDDAHLVEKMGYPVKMVNGSRLNIKITTVEDLELAQAIIRLR